MFKKFIGGFMILFGLMGLSTVVNEFTIGGLLLAVFFIFVGVKAIKSF